MKRVKPAKAVVFCENIAEIEGKAGPGAVIGWRIWAVLSFAEEIWVLSDNLDQSPLE